MTTKNRQRRSGRLKVDGHWLHLADADFAPIVAWKVTTDTLRPDLPSGIRRDDLLGWVGLIDLHAIAMQENFDRRWWYTTTGDTYGRTRTREEALHMLVQNRFGEQARAEDGELLERHGVGYVPLAILAGLAPSE